MKQNDFDQFSSLLTATADYYGRKLAPDSIRIYWSALSGLDLAAVQQLLNEHVKSSKFMPTVSELLDVVKTMDGRPGTEEAWSICARSLNDESITIVWTEEMAVAFGAALALQEDRIAARMAFKERYEELVKEARKQGKAAKWTPSLGLDPYGREGPLLDAVHRGRLTATHVMGLLPYRESLTKELKALIESKTKQLEAPETEPA